MRTKSKIWNYQLAIIIVLLTTPNGCKHVESETEPEQIPKVTTNVSDISATSAICVGNIIPCGGLRCGICWSNINSNPTLSGDSKLCSSCIDSCSFYIKLDHLTPGTTYYVRGFAENGAGAGYGNVITFSTLGSAVGDILFNPNLMYGSLTDITGNTYKTIKIGSQTWMAENLKTSKYNDDTAIPFIPDQKTWRGLSTPGYCWYLNDESKYKNTYGALYKWYTVETGKLCPKGWHVPTLEEWATLSSYLGVDSVASGQLRETGTTHWITIKTGVTNSSGFTALPGGVCENLSSEYYPDRDAFLNLGYTGAFWSSNTVAGLYLYDLGGSWDIYYDYNNNYFGSWAYLKSDGLSVRCVQDN